MTDQPAPESISDAILPTPESYVVERIFPIRNIVDEHTDESDSEKARHEGPVSIADPIPDEYLPPPFPSIPSDDQIRRLPPTIATRVENSGLGGGDEGHSLKRHVSERAQLVPHKHEGPPGAALEEAGKATFHRCEDEPIHIPGAIQQYGALVALRYAEDEHDPFVKNVLVRIASENSEHILGYNPEQLFRLTSFCNLLGTAQAKDFLIRFDHILKMGHNTKGNTDLDVFTMTLIGRGQTKTRLWCALHLSAGTKDLVICEFEVQEDTFFPGTPGVLTLPQLPVRTIDIDVTDEERTKSTTSRSQPLRALQVARQQQSRLGFMEMFNSLSQVQAQLAAVKTLQDALDIVVGVVQEISHFHRVMVYRFDQNHNGAVDAELLDPRASDDFFRGLHFPASDIPEQARELYKVNKIRILYDRDQETARLVCRDDSDFRQPLNLTHSYLRAISPIHLKYLGNMGVRSSMSISLVINNELWGLVACHSYGEQGIKVPLPIRELCRNIGECASNNIDRLLMATRLMARNPSGVAPPRQTPSGFIAASSADLLSIFDADFGMISIQDEARTIGRPKPYREALALLAHLQRKKLTKIVSSQNIAVDFPNIRYAPGIKAIAGMLVIPLSLLGGDFIVFFRVPHLKEVRWGGNPYEKLIRKGTEHYLEPRSSFHRWTEIVGGTSKEWTDDQVDTAAILSLLYGRFIEVWRQKEMAVQRSRMTRLLLRNSSHEVRTPLNAIINYLEIALESELDEITLQVIAQAHKASKSLVYVIDDLLNLTKAEGRQVFVPMDTFDLGATVSEVISTFRRESMRKGLDLTVSTHPGLPRMVKGDPTRLRQVISNVTSNAFQHSASGGIKVDIKPLQVKKEWSMISITVQDLGAGMSERQLDDLFQEFEQILDEEDRDPAEETTQGVHYKKGLGLGLAVVARYVRNMNGQIRVKSELGKGTIFTIELPFDHAVGTPISGANLPRRSSFFPISTGGPSPGSTMSESGERYSSSATDISTPGDGSNTQYQTVEDIVPSSALALGTTFPSLASMPTHSIAMTVEQKSTSNDSANTDSILTSTGLSSNEMPSEQSMYPFPDMASYDLEEPRRFLKILMAEDNPINSKMLQRRLEKSGHEVHVAVDGQVCYDTYKRIMSPSNSTDHKFDAILMDLQMPLVDGHASARMIRKLEREHAATPLAQNRIPMFAVSASLEEAQRYDYIGDGFDAWVLKPIDYNRLEMLMQGIHQSGTRKKALYGLESWEKGGWFMS